MLAEEKRDFPKRLQEIHYLHLKLMARFKASFFLALAKKKKSRFFSLFFFFEF
jgi:hypothetical protein